MPELPEVETIARGVDERVRGARILAAWLGSHREPMKTSPRVQEKALTGAQFVSVQRVGKHIVCHLTGPAHQPGSLGAESGQSPELQWVVHLGMTGRLLVTDSAAEVVAHTHARLTLEDGREIRFVDARRFGRLELRNLRHQQAFHGPGTEPLNIDPEAFQALFHHRKTSIKAALLNQNLLHGVGNIYADESLFRAGIRPQTRSHRLTRAQLERLRVALQEVLTQAIQLGGSSVSDYVDANGVKGFFQLEHRVYGREGQSCRVCGAAIRRVQLAGRSTHFCPACQR